MHARQRAPPPVPLRAPPVTSTQEVPLSQLWASLPLENRRRLSQIMARVIARHSLPRRQEVPDAGEDPDHGRRQEPGQPRRD